ncbi:PTS system fructose-specific IIC component [Entomoplasma freundtii]|uniref:PTS system, fructose-specific IIABC component n=1 Tax=Entomoplasma freundtii TaxID=74700 RepID=A0A2K8NRW2_9MOLU|nr:fructose-specific PTS transporter subunit EIIC [Entomoplasma freundtii]ATZ16592.1 PTS system, fructose-specific IIABC component [Entomoplasma freundtii]TDY58242.1 PTS system fructose-specific IIC component [Entomoplasma freundtii]
MEVKDLFHKGTSFFHEDLKSKAEVIDFLAAKLSEDKIISSKTDFVKAIKAREKEGSTGMGDGIAIPHALTPTVKKSTIAFLSLKHPVEWESLDDKPVDLIFMIATNGEDGDEHLQALAGLSGYLLKPKVVEALRKADSFATLEKAFSVPKEKANTEAKKETNKSGHYDVVGITACPTGIAHTYLAQDKLLEAAHDLGLTAKVETQGRRGVEDRLTQEDIDNAKYIILAHDKAIEGMSRFNGKKVIDTNTKDVIYKGKEIIKDYKNNPKLVEIKGLKKDDGEGFGDMSLKKFKDVKGNFLAGVSKMLPFVVAGGIILGIAFLIDFAAGNSDAKGAFGVTNKAAGWFAAIGKISMMMMVPILGAYIAYTIVGPQGLMPGMVAGLIADNTGGWMYGTYNYVPGMGGNPAVGNPWGALWSRLFPQNIPMTSGFLGAMAGGYMAALIVFGLTLGMKKFKRSFQGVRDIVFIPVLSLLGIGITMFAINIPLGYALWGIQEGLRWLATHNLLIVLGAIIGLMMCIDMGGPINKIAYVLGTLSVNGDLGHDPLITNIMAAAMAGGMVPPLGIALCTVIFRKEWTGQEREAAKANWLMGAFFITEGAIPFMVTDPKRVPVSAMAGGVVTGVLVGAFKITLPAPHGGICVFPLLDSHLFNGAGMQKGMGVVLYIAAILVGVGIMATILGFWKKSDIRHGKLSIVKEAKAEKIDAAK